MMKFVLFSCFVSFILAGKPFSVNSNTNRVIDQYGRERYFHGLNVVTKGPPYVPTTDKFDPKTSFAKEDMEVFQSLGLNVIRLGVMWAGVEPVEGQYNETYLAQIKSIVDLAYSYGIYSVLDMHQDVISEKFCGEGLPLWAVPNVSNGELGFPFPLHINLQPNETQRNGLPLAGVCEKYVPAWASGYVAYQTGFTFENLYTNVGGLTDKWAAFWKKVATVFAGYGEAVLGYELINEPFVGNPWAHIELMIPGVADKERLQPAFEVLNTAIRSVDDERIIFIDGIPWDDFCVGFTSVPGGEAYRNRTVLSYHYYVPPQFNLEYQFKVRQADCRTLGVAGFLTEFYLEFIGSEVACDPDIPDSVNTSITTPLVHMLQKRNKNPPQNLTIPMFGETYNVPVSVMAMADKYLQSWIGWEYKPMANNRTGWGAAIFNPDTGARNDGFVYNLTRTYPMVVAGVTQSFFFNYTTKAAFLVYNVSAQVQSNTSLIYFNQPVHYPNGVNVIASPSSVVASVQGNIVTIQHSTQSLPGSQVVVTIAPKN